MLRWLFVTEGDAGYVPCESTVGLTEGSFHRAGELMAMSLAQGGPPPNFLSKWVYDHLSSGIRGVEVDFARLRESSFGHVAEKVRQFYVRVRYNFFTKLSSVPPPSHPDPHPHPLAPETVFFNKIIYFYCTVSMTFCSYYILPLTILLVC